MLILRRVVFRLRRLRSMACEETSHAIERLNSIL